MITTNTGAKKMESTDEWRQIVATSGGAHNDTVDAYDHCIGALQDSLGIVVDGKQAAVSATIGQYVILKNSTIVDSGTDMLPDGLYTAAKAISANTDIDKTYLTAVSSGGLNSLNSKIENSLAGYRFTQFGGSGGATVTLTVPDSLRAWVLCNGGNSNMRGIFTFTTTSGGTPNQTILGGSPSGYTFDNTTNNKIKVTFANPCECIIIHGADKQITVS